MIEGDPNYPDAPPPQQPGAGGPPTFEQVNADYQNYLGRPLSQAEYDQYWANATNYDASMVANSPEGIARINQNVPGTPEYDPTVPVAPANETGQGGPPTQPNPTSPAAPPTPAPPQTRPPTHPPTLNTGPTNPGIGATPPPQPAPPPAPPAVAPKPNIPGYTPPPAFSYADYTGPDKFSYADFVAPDPSELNKDPTFNYTLKTEQDAINRSAAARGILNTGGTINDLLVNANDVTQQGYQNLWNRKQQEYATNRANAFSNYNTNEGNRYQDYMTNRENAVNTYNTNYKTQFTDPYTYKYQAAQDDYNASQHNFDLEQYYKEHGIDRDTATATHNTDLNRQYDWYQKLFGYQQSQDEWERKFKLLGLL